MAATVTSLFADRVQLDPDAAAVVLDAQECTYAALDARANCLAAQLRRMGVSRGVQVGIYAERSLEMIAGILATLKAGGAYVPLDRTLPPSRIEHILEETQAAVLLTQRDIAPLATAAAQIALDSFDWTKSEETRVSPSGEATDQDRIYIIYTSGSTGTPKGVEVSHQSVVNLLCWLQDTYRLSPSDRVLQNTPITFDVSVAELFWPLINGATLVLARPEGHRDSSYLVDLVQKQRVSRAFFVPSMLHAILLTPGISDWRTVKQVYCAGEPLSVDLKDAFYAVLDGELHNLYGPTEATVFATAWRCAPTEDVVPIGRPIANSSVYVLDEHRQPVSNSEPGELYIGGRCLAIGYFNQPALTAERFVKGPNGIPESRLYRTGDRVRFRSDGNLEFLGRIDQQIKLRGYRIEPGEIESVLNHHSAIDQSVVLSHGFGPNDHRLVAFVVIKAGMTPPKEESLRGYLAARLPSYMVASTIIPLISLPYTANGKIDRNALRALFSQHLRDDAAGLAPHNSIEIIVSQIWAEVLQKGVVGPRDDFFRLGGHSLISMRVVNRINKIFQLDLPFSSLFERPTPSAMAELIEEQRRTAEHASMDTE